MKSKNKIVILSFFLVLLLIFLVYFQPVKSYQSYRNMANPVILELTWAYFMNLNEYKNITTNYPSKKELSDFYPKMENLNEDLAQMGYSVAHHFQDNSFYLKLTSDSGKSIFPIKLSNGKGYLDYLFNGKALIFFYSDDICVDENCNYYDIGIIKNGQLLSNDSLKLEAQKIIWDHLESYQFKNELNYKAYCSFNQTNNHLRIYCEINSLVIKDTIFYDNLKSELFDFLSDIKADLIYFPILINPKLD